MASIRERNGKFNVIYSYTNEKGERKQKWETYETKAEAKRRKKEIEYKKEMGSFVVRKCKTLDELITEYVALYGKENWALSTYEGNVSLINNYILPIIGDTKLSEINTRFIERYYQSLLKRRAVINPLNKTSRNEFVSSSTVRDINKLLRNCFEQAVKWELMEKNPCTHATVPKHKSQKRDIWTADTLMYALSVCEDERLKLAINLSFSCSLRKTQEGLLEALKGTKTIDLIGQETGESPRQVLRYIRLTSLIPELLDMLDEGKISFNPAVELSFLSIIEQGWVADGIEYTLSVPSVSQAKRMKALSQEKQLSPQKINEILNEIKKTDMSRVIFKNSQMYKYFPKYYSTEQMKEEIIDLLEKERKRKERQRKVVSNKL